MKAAPASQPRRACLSATTRGPERSHTDLWQASLNGIEIIYLKVEAYFTDKIHGSVEVQIAGEKGHKTLEVETAAKVPALAG